MPHYKTFFQIKQYHLKWLFSTWNAVKKSNSMKVRTAVVKQNFAIPWGEPGKWDTERWSLRTLASCLWPFPGLLRSPTNSFSPWDVSLSGAEKHWNRIQARSGREGRRLVNQQCPFNAEILKHSLKLASRGDTTDHEPSMVTDLIMWPQKVTF